MLDTNQPSTGSQGALFIPSAITKGSAAGFPELDKAKATVSLAPMFIANPDMPQMAMEVPDHIALAIKNDATGEVLSTCGAQHTPIQNQYLHDMMRNAFKSVLPSAWVDNIRLKEGTSRGSAFNCMAYHSPDYSSNIRQSSGLTTSLDFGMMVMNAHGSRAVTVRPFMLDNSCGNTVMFCDLKAVKQHTEGFDASVLSDFTKRMLRQAPEHFKMIQGWANKPITADDLDGILTLNLQISANARDAIIDYFNEVEVPKRGENLYAGVSAMAAWNTHNTGDFYVRNSRNSDNEAETLFQRQEKVAKVIASDAFQQVAA